MIGLLRGKIISKQPPNLILDVNGVGYEVLCSMQTFYHLENVNDEITLLTQLIVREDAQLLYGFYNIYERELFRALIKVNGIGPKMALTILSSVEPDNFVASINAKDCALLTKIPGVGKKTAERLIIEMRDKLKDWQYQNKINVNAVLLINNNSAIDDAISALTALGYKINDANKIVYKVAQENLSSAAIIRLALKHLAN